MKLHFERRVLAGVIITLTILIAFGVLSFYSTQRLIQTERMYTHRTRVDNATDQIVKLAVDIETGQRGYVITGDTVFLEPFHEASRMMASHLYILDSLTSTSNEEKIQVAKLRDLVSRQSSWTWEVIEVRKTSFEQARDLVTKKMGKLLMDSIRTQAKILKEEEERFFLARNKISRGNIKIFQYSILGMFAAVVMLIMYLFYNVNRQLNARTAAEAKLKEVAAKTKDLYDNAPCGYHSLNKEGVFEEINHTELQWLGYTEEEVIHRLNIISVLSPESRVKFAETFESLKKEGVINDLELEFVRKDGSQFPVILSATTLVDEEGRFIKSRTTVFDNTDRKRAEEELKKSMNTVRDLYDNAPCGYLLVNSAIEIDDMNQTLLNWLGYTREEVVGKLPYEQLLSNDSKLLHNQTVQERFENFKRKGFSNNNEIEYKRKDKSILPVLVNSIAFYDDKGNFINSRSSIFDNTERKKAESRILQLNQELEAFTYSVSHDLRAPLRSITGYAQILKEDFHGRLDEEAHGIVDVIVRNAKRMGQLVDDLLDFAQLGRKGLAVSSVNMEELIAGIISEFRANENGRQINIKVLPLSPAKVDLSMMRQVWTNLLSNALKYSRKREITNIEIGCYPAEGNEKLCYYIRDNGAGFDMKYADKLFGVFQRLHKMNEFEGTGVGLALVKRIIQRHGGAVGADGKVEQGATFYYTLPISQTE